MKCQALLSGAALLLPMSVAGQSGPITITQANFPATANTVEKYLPAHTRFGASGSIALPQTGANQVWDYSGLVADSSVLEHAYQRPTVASGPVGFSPVTRSGIHNSSGSTVEMFMAKNHFWPPYQQHEGLASSGLRVFGYTMGQLQWHTMEPDAANRIYWLRPVQHVVSTGNNYRIKFPLTAGSSSVSTSRSIVLFEVTSPLLGLTAATVRQVRRVTQSDTVVGYGQLRLPTASAGPVTFPALMQRSIIRVVDSLYVGSQPAPAALLASINMQQGQQSETFRTVFYRENSAQPALQMFYPDATFQVMHDFFGVWFSVEASLSTLSSSTLYPFTQTVLQAFPNPVVDGWLTLVQGKAGEQLQLAVYDLTGRKVAAGTALSGLPTPVLRDLSAGLYTIVGAAKEGQLSRVRVQVK